MPRQLAALLVLAAACTSAPYTHRSQLMLISTQEENKLGAQAFREVVSKSRIDTNAAVTQPVEATGVRIAHVAERPDYQWRFVVIDDPKQVNAFCHRSRRKIGRANV